MEGRFLDETTAMDGTSHHRDHGTATRSVAARRLALAVLVAVSSSACGGEAEGSMEEGSSTATMEGGSGSGSDSGEAETTAAAGDADTGATEDTGGSSSGGGASTGGEELDPDRETEEVVELGDEQWQAYTDIVIEATPEQVWEVLTDFEAMPTWSSSLQGIEGPLADGASVVVTFIVFEMTYELDHTLIHADGEHFGWADPVLGYDGISDHHLYVVGETDGTHTLFIQEDTFTGTSEVATAQELAQTVAPIYTAFNRELEAEVEARFGG